MTLRAKLVITMFILGIIIVILSTGFMTKYNKKMLTEDILGKNRDIALAISISLDNYMSELANITKTLASTPSFKQYLLDSIESLEPLDEADRRVRFNELNERWANTDDVEELFIKEYLSNPVAKYLKNQLEVIPDLYGEIFLTDKYGKLVASTTKLTTFTHEEKYWWLGGYNGGKGKIFFDDRGYDVSAGEFVLGVVAPVYHDDEVIGILKCNMKIFSLFDEIIKSYSPLYKPGTVKIARTNGQVVLELGKPPLSTKVDKNLLPIIKEDGISKILENQKGEDILFSISSIKNTKDYGDYSFGGDYETIDHTLGNEGDNWAVILTMPKHIIDDKVFDLTKQFLVVGIMSVIFVALFALVFIGGTTKALTELANFAEGVGWKDLNKHVEVRSGDEIGILAKSFNNMLDNLKETMASKEELSMEINKRMQVEEKLRYLSTIDELTQLYNRRAFNDYLDKYIHHSRNFNELFSLVMIDIDHYKRINDQYGHNIGDRILIKLSKILSENIRKVDILSRWGGEEFMILMPSIGVKEAYIAAERLRSIVEDTELERGIHITISVGATEFNDTDSFNDLIKRVDDAQYKAKGNGRNNVQIL